MRFLLRFSLPHLTVSLGARTSSSRTRHHHLFQRSSRMSSSTVDVYPWGTPVADDRSTKLVHFLRHAQGTHNVNNDYRSKDNLDAPLTETGMVQCAELAQRIATATDGPLYQLRESAQLIVTSPLRRCIQTATLSLRPLVEREIPMVAHESVRETVNYNCDRRRVMEEITKEHPAIDYKHMEHEHDDIWRSYEERFGCDETFTRHRESGEIHVVAERGRAFFQWLQDQPERHVVVCTHSAFLRCLKNFGNNPNEGVLGVPLLPEQHADPPSQIIPVLQYDCDAFAQEMRRDYENCELRSLVVAFRDD